MEFHKNPVHLFNFLVKYNELVNKRKIVLEDKKKLEHVIAELDRKKHEALAQAIEHVNHEFESIFKTLLPGAQAKLVANETTGTATHGRGRPAAAASAPAGEKRFDGIEFRVAFGTLWKESLSELSGGQRYSTYSNSLHFYHLHLYLPIN